MTSEGIMNLFSTGTTPTPLVNGSKTDTSKKAVDFSNVFSINVKTSDKGFGNSKVDFGDSANQSYESFKYKDKDVESASINPFKEKIEQNQEEIEDFKNQVVEIISIELDVSEEDVVKALEEFGLSVFDLLNPQNLAKLDAFISGIEESAILVLDSNFQKLMSDVNSLGKELMNVLEIEPSQFDEFVKMMEVLEHPVEIDVAVSEPMVQELVESGVIETNNVEVTNDDEKYIIAGDSSKEDVVESVKTNEVEMETTFEENENSEYELQQGETKEKKVQAGTVDENVTVAREYSNQTTPVSDANGTIDNSYVSVDTVKMIQEIAERIKVAVSTEVSTMQMELNPENLGKIYLNVSAKEGVTSAQIFATNETVKEAIESQIVNLKETLQNSGMKVEDVEVSVATHEFERNLEQHHSREEQEGAYQEEQSSKRRNINISSLDELSGIMSEEETLVAQIMKDNGNSVDFTA